MNEACDDCLLCRVRAADSRLSRIQVWEDELWRLTVSLEAGVPGFAYLEPKRHIPTLADLSGDPLSNQMIRGELVSEQLVGGATRIVSREFPPLPAEKLKQVAEEIADRLSTDS